MPSQTTFTLPHTLAKNRDDLEIGKTKESDLILKVNFTAFYSILDQGHLRRMVLENCFLILFLHHTITVGGILEHLDVKEVT